MKESVACEVVELSTGLKVALHQPNHAETTLSNVG
jgi:hypothetical protein